MQYYNVVKNHEQITCYLEMVNLHNGQCTQTHKQNVFLNFRIEFGVTVIKLANCPRGLKDENMPEHVHVHVNLRSAGILYS